MSEIAKITGIPRESYTLADYLALIEDASPELLQAVIADELTECRREKIVAEYKENIKGASAGQAVVLAGELFETLRNLKPLEITP